MDRIRQVALAVALIAIGLGAGHFVQQDAAGVQVSELPDVRPSSVVPLAAGPEDVELPQPAPLTSFLPLPDAGAIVPQAPADVQARGCSVHTDLLPRAEAVVSVTVIAPCHPDERVVIKHGGLAITERTSPNGVLFVDVPALEVDASFEILFADGETSTAEIRLPEVTQLQRFAVQWLEDDAFQISAYANGADFGAAGHVSAINPQTPGSDNGFLTLLGDASVSLPMLAEIYTYPADGKTEVVVEAAVTEATCGRELLGETILAAKGVVKVQELTLAMPDCVAEGDILVLKNLAPGTTLANR